MRSVIIFLCIIVFLNAMDNDKDFVDDSVDKCLNTKEGVAVTSDGCIKVLKFTVNFDSNEDMIESEYIPIMNNIVQLATEYYGYNIYINGHTDSISTQAYNLSLSKNRALKVSNILKSYDISSSRIHTFWYGELEPISTNITSDGRFQNRRVDIYFK